jgi:hypothetical protein
MSHLMQVLHKQEAARQPAQRAADPRLMDRPYVHMSMDELLDAIELKHNATIRPALIAELYAREGK